jgi:exonuclease VII large subunit
VVTDRAGKLVTAAEQARQHDSLVLTFADGKLDVTTGVPLQGRLL